MKCEVFLCPEDATHSAVIMGYSGLRSKYLMCRPHATGDFNIQGRILSVEALEEASLPSVVLDRIQNVVFRESGEACAGEFRCATCGAQIYDLENGDWLECIVVKAFEHKCKGGMA